MKFQLIGSCAEQVARRSFSGPDFQLQEFSPLVHTLHIMREKALELLQKALLYNKNINNSRKTWCKMDVSTPPSLDLACPQSKTEIEKHVYMLR